MPYCSFCGTEIAGDMRFCPDCGKPVSKSKSIPNADDIATIDIDYEATATSPLPPRPPSSSQRSASRTSTPADYLASEGRYLPGRLLAGRYRIIALLGKGGMGEVYRADNLTLGQAVAMKFLPEQATSNEAMLGRFKNEVRIARRVSHPNVCRVYDVGEVDGATFFTMEYIDGEDLASLLRRIGRLPQDKAVEIARQICAGLSAAHAKGVLHRDLKPANIMVTAEGRVKVLVAAAMRTVSSRNRTTRIDRWRRLQCRLLASRPKGPAQNRPIRPQPAARQTCPSAFPAEVSALERGIER